jgi:hypothetical protein
MAVRHRDLFYQKEGWGVPERGSKISELVGFRIKLDIG